MYKAQREWRDGLFLISKETAKQIVKEKCKKEVHCMIAANPSMMLGADWSIESFDNFIDKWKDDMQVERVWLAIPSQMGHAIAIPMDKLYLFDVGEIEESELEIVDKLD